MNARDSVPKMNQQIDWSGIRAAAVVIGVREAARRSAINLTPEEQVRFTNRVLQRSKREGWLTQKQADSAQTLTLQQSKPLSSSVITGSEAALSKLKQDAEETKLDLSTGIKAAAKYIKDLPGVMLMAGAQNVKHIVSAASQIHGWDTQHGGGSINLNILTGQAAVQINSGKSISDSN